MIVHPRIWLLACAWCLIFSTAPVQASWEAYQRAGETAYKQGDYTEAERLFLAAVREVRYFGPQDPRLDISLSKLALLRVVRGLDGETKSRSQRTEGITGAARRGQTWRGGGQRRPPRTALQRAKPGQRKQGVRVRVAPQERQLTRPRAGLHRTQPTRRVAPPLRPGKPRESVRRRPSRREQQFIRPRAVLQRPARQGGAAHPARLGKRREDIRVPHLQGRQLQRPRTTLRRTGAPQPDRPRRPDSKRQGTRVRSAQRAILHAKLLRMAQLWLLQGATDGVPRSVWQ